MTRSEEVIAVERCKSRRALGSRGIVARLTRLGLTRYGQFCIVGGTGVLVDMGVLWALASPAMLGWNLSVSKLTAAEVAILNNFLWNDIWTFRDRGEARSDWRHRLTRLVRFNLICSAGIGLSVVLLNFQVHSLGLNVMFANLAAIVLVSAWNFSMNLRFGWNRKAGAEVPCRRRT